MAKQQDWYTPLPEDMQERNAILATWLDTAADAIERIAAQRDELLVACEAALAFHNRYCDRVGAGDDWARSVHEKLRAAVEKAKGE